MWIGKRIYYSFLKLFEYHAFIHIDKEYKNKLDAKYQKCYFIGYGIDGLGYRLWDVDNQKLIRSRGVIFNEMCLYENRL